MKTSLSQIILASILIGVVLSTYNTMPVSYRASPAMNVFSVTYVNALSGPPFSQGGQQYTTFSFATGRTYSTTPKVTMAIIRYQASASLANTYTIIYAQHTSITASSFSMTHYISSGVWIICYRMMLLEQPFAYHLNLFTNDVSQSAQTFGATTFQRNLIDYNALSLSYSYTFTTFGVVNGSDYSMNKIITFVSCMGFYGSAGSIPMVDISSTILNSTHFYMDFVFGSSVYIDRYHVNMIVFDQGQMQGSGLFKMNYAHVNFSSATGGQYPVPQQYIDTTIMGWTDFSASSQTKFLTFNVTFANLTNQPPNATVLTGIKMLPPVAIGGNPVANTIGISLFYLQDIFCSNTSYFHDTVNQICVQCSIIPYCLTCTSATVCTNCSVGYYIDAANLCSKIICGIPYCDLCLNTTACYQCNYTLNYYLDTGLGCSYCDNQWNMYINMSSPGKECVDCSIVTCDFVKSMEYYGVQKSGCNQMTVTMKNQDMSLQKARNLMKVLNQGIFITQLIRNTSSFFIITISYTRDIVNQTIQLQVAGRIYNISYNPLIPALYYSESQCQVSQHIDTLLKGCTGASYFIMLLSLISGKIVGLQLFGILQLSYMTLSEHSFLNMYLAPILNFKIFNGLNMAFLPQRSKALPQILQKMSVSSNFLNNFNIMLAVFYIYLLVTASLYFLFKLAINFKFQKLTTRLFKQGMITLILFNCFNVAFSAGVHFRYADPIQDQHYWIGLIVSVITFVVFAAIVVAMQVTHKDTFGQFNSKFKNCQSQLFIPFLVGFRTALGLFCAMKNDYQFSTIFIVGLSILFTMYVIINLPFTDFIQNYRTALIQISTLFILLAADYYRTMKSNTPMSIKGRIYVPAIIQLVLIALCIVVSFGVLVRELYQFVKECIRASKQGQVGNFQYNHEYNKSNVQLNATQGDIHVAGAHPQ